MEQDHSKQRQQGQTYTFDKKRKISKMSPELPMLSFSEANFAKGKRK